MIAAAIILKPEWVLVGFVAVLVLSLLAYVGGRIYRGR